MEKDTTHKHIRQIEVTRNSEVTISVQTTLLVYFSTKCCEFCRWCNHSWTFLTSIIVILEYPKIRLNIVPRDITVEIMNIKNNQEVHDTVKSECLHV